MFGVRIISSFMLPENILTTLLPNQVEFLRSGIMCFRAKHIIRRATLSLPLTFLSHHRMRLFLAAFTFKHIVFRTSSDSTQCFTSPSFFLRPVDDSCIPVGPLSTLTDSSWANQASSLTSRAHNQTCPSICQFCPNEHTLRPSLCIGSEEFRVDLLACLGSRPQKLESSRLITAKSPPENSPHLSHWTTSLSCRLLDWILELCWT